MANPTEPSAIEGAVLELEGVDVPVLREPNRIALRNVEWRVEPGDRWLVVGWPGTGKSSALGVAAGLARPLRGSHRLFGVDLARLGEAEQVSLRARLGLVFGGGGRLFSSLSVRDNLALPMGYHGRKQPGNSHQSLDEFQKAFRLGPYSERFPSEVPRGIAQRAALARALALGPEILLLDDPIQGLAPSEADWWIHFCRDSLAGYGIRTLVVATADPAPWQEWMNRFACVENRAWRVLPDRPALHHWLEVSAGN